LKLQLYPATDRMWIGPWCHSKRRNVIRKNRKYQDKIRELKTTRN